MSLNPTQAASGWFFHSEVVICFFLEPFSHFDFDRQTAYFPSHRDGDKKHLAEGVPFTGEGMAFSGKAHGFTNAAICGDHLENNIEGRESQRVGFVIVGLGHSD